MGVMYHTMLVVQGLLLLEGCQAAVSLSLSLLHLAKTTSFSKATFPLRGTPPCSTRFPWKACLESAPFPSSFSLLSPVQPCSPSSVIVTRGTQRYAWASQRREILAPVTQGCLVCIYSQSSHEVLLMFSFLCFLFHASCPELEEEGLGQITV